jgi:hypothetical protein
MRPPEVLPPAHILTITAPVAVPQGRRLPDPIGTGVRKIHFLVWCVSGATAFQTTDASAVRTRSHNSPAPSSAIEPYPNTRPKEDPMIAYRPIAPLDTGPPGLGSALAAMALTAARGTTWQIPNESSPAPKNTAETAGNVYPVAAGRNQQ